MRYKVILLVVALFVCCAGPAGFAQQETLPPYHWAYNYIDELWQRGYFEGLFIFNQPYTRAAVVEQIDLLRQGIERGKLKPDQREEWLIRRLEAEFQDDLLIFNQDSPGSRGIFGGYFTGDLQVGSELTDQTRVRSRVAYSPFRNLTFSNAMVLDTRLDDDPRYIGNTRFGSAGFTEQAYARFAWKGLEFLAGRDHVRWGAGRESTLLFSDLVRPLDMFKFGFSNNFLRFTFFTSMLDAMMVPDSTGGAVGEVSANRYVAAHRLDLRIGGWLNLGFSETIVYGGPGRKLEFAFLNPFLFFHGDVLNGPGEGNTFGTIDLYVRPLPGFGIYGSLLIDDIQFDKAKVSDLEPNEIGIITGLRVARLEGTDFWAEYSRVTNRTYNAGLAFEKAVHRNFPLGHVLGNDFDRWLIGGSRWVRPGLQLALEYEHIRRGEGEVLEPFDRPWLQSTLEEGYDEPFPTGVVEATDRLGLRATFHPLPELQARMELGYSKVTQAGHVPDDTRNDFSIELGLFWTPAKSVSF